MLRITGKIAQEISAIAHELSDRRVAICQIGQDLGRGARVIDGNRQLVWLAEPRSATAYYLGQVDGLTRVLGDRVLRGRLDEDQFDLLTRVRAEVLAGYDKPAEQHTHDEDVIADWYERGIEDGEHRAVKR